MKHLGDITKINWFEVEPVDCVTGGLPLCWTRCNGKGTALWASEVEPFCIAVTKIRFGRKVEQ